MPKETIVGRLLFLCTVCLFAGCASSPQKKDPSGDPCYEYNLGTRIAPRLAPYATWPAVVDRSNIKKLEFAELSIATEGPKKYQATLAEIEGAIESEIRKAGPCYPGSNFYRVVDGEYGINADIARINARAESTIQDWETIEDARINREEAWARIPRELKIVQAGPSLVEVLEISDATQVKVRLTNTDVGRVIKPITAVFWGYDQDSPNIGGLRATGFQLSDNFGNTFFLSDVQRKLTEADAGLHPGNSMVFSLKFTGTPPDSATTFVLTVDRGALGNPSPLSFELPRSLILR